MEKLVIYIFEMFDSHEFINNTILPRFNKLIRKYTIKIKIML